MTTTANNPTNDLADIRQALKTAEQRLDALRRREKEISIDVTLGRKAAIEEYRTLTANMNECERQIVIGRMALDQARRAAVDERLAGLAEIFEALTRMYEPCAPDYYRKLESARSSRTADSVRAAYTAARLLYKRSSDLQALTGDRRRYKFGFTVRLDLGPQLSALVPELWKPNLAKPVVPDPEWDRLVAEARRLAGATTTSQEQPS